jgi:hypothetical protein
MIVSLAKGPRTVSSITTMLPLLPALVAQETLKKVDRTMNCSVDDLGQTLLS